MVDQGRPVLDMANGRSVSDVARRIFGNVRLEFPDDRARRNKLVSARFGPARFTHLKAGRHFVVGGDLMADDCRRDAIKVMFQKRGRAELTQGRHRLTMEPESLIFYDPAKPYEIENRDSVEVQMLHLPRAALGKVGKPFQVAVKEGEPTSTLLSLITASGAELPGLDLRARQALGSSMTKLARAILANESANALQSSSMSLLLARIKRYIAAELHDPDLSAAMIARRMSCSQRYVYLAFEGQGATPADYIWRERLKAAASALRTIEARPGIITDIAYAHGFSSSAHFARLFREAYACSPREWMRKY